MKVLTLSTSEEVKAVTAEKLQTEKYDKIVINGVTDLDPKFYTKFSQYVSEIEATDCALLTPDWGGRGTVIYVKECKCTFTNTKMDGTQTNIDGYLSTIIIDNCPSTNPIHVSSDDGISNFTFSNSSNLNIFFDVTSKKPLSKQFGTITFLNCSKLNVRYLPSLRAIPSTNVATFMAQFKSLSTLIDINKIDDNNYEITQADWDKASSLIEQYPSLLQQFTMHQTFSLDVNSPSVYYYHIPSLSIPLPWVRSLLPASYYDYKTVMSSEFFLNKNNKPNFTITHFNDIPNKSATTLIHRAPIFIADNYDEVVNRTLFSYAYSKIYVNGYEYCEPSMLSGKLATSEITLIPNSLFQIITLDQNMQKHITKVRTGMYGKTIKITSMEPFGALKVFGTKASDIDGALGTIGLIQNKIDGKLRVVYQIEKELVGTLITNGLIQNELGGTLVTSCPIENSFDGNLRVGYQAQSDIDGSLVVAQRDEKEIEGVLVTGKPLEVEITGAITASQRFEYELDSIISINKVEKDFEGSISISKRIKNELDGTIAIANQVQKEFAGNIVTSKQVKNELTGSLAVSNLVEKELDGIISASQSIQKILDGEFTIVTVCRVEILGDLEVLVKEVNG